MLVSLDRRNLIDFHCTADLIQQACQRGDEAALDLHLRRRRHLQSISSRSSLELPITALHIAASLGNDKIVSKLLKNGFIVHTRDYSQHTPLFLAAKNGHLSTIILLRSAGAHLTQDEIDLARYYNSASIGRPDQQAMLTVWERAGVSSQP